MKEMELTQVPCPLCHGQVMREERMLNGYKLDRCDGCDFVFANPQPTFDALDRIYRANSSAEKVDLYARIATPAISREYDIKLEQIERWVGGTGRLLDYACAAGYFYERALLRGWEAHGLDIGDWCRLAAERRGLPNMHIGRLEKAGFAPGYFDVIYAGQVFEHLPRPRDDVQQLFRLLRPGGFLFADVPNYRCLSVLLGRDQFALNTPPQHINYFTPKTLTRLVEGEGFVVRDLNADGGLNWENILGIPLRSDILSAYQEPDPAGEQVSQADSNPSRGGLVKRALMPLVKSVLYNSAKLGICLNVVAQRPPDSFTGTAS